MLATTSSGKTLWPYLLGCHALPTTCMQLLARVVQMNEALQLATEDRHSFKDQIIHAKYRTVTKWTKKKQKQDVFTKTVFLVLTISLVLSFHHFFYEVGRHATFAAKMKLLYILLQ